ADDRHRAHHPDGKSQRKKERAPQQPFAQLFPMFDESHRLLLFHYSGNLLSSPFLSADVINGPVCIWLAGPGWDGFGSSSSTSLAPFLNSRSVLPNARPSSGSLLGPNSNSAIKIIT